MMIPEDCCDLSWTEGDRPIKVYFDMDGVLADFARGLREMCGMDAPTQGTGGDDVVFDAIRRTPHFYLRLEPNRRVVEIFRMLDSIEGVSCAVLTGIPKPSRGIVDAEQDKREWVERHLGPDTEFIAVERRHKADYAKDSILFDDYPPNIEEWDAAGGCGILADGRPLGHWGIISSLEPDPLLIRFGICRRLIEGKVAGVRVVSEGSGFGGCRPGACFKSSLSVTARGTVSRCRWVWDEGWRHHLERRRKRVSPEEARRAIASMVGIAMLHDPFGMVRDGSTWKMTVKLEDGSSRRLSGCGHCRPEGTEEKIARLTESVGFPGCWLF